MLNNQKKFAFLRYRCGDREGQGIKRRLFLRRPINSSSLLKITETATCVAENEEVEALLYFSPMNPWSATDLSPLQMVGRLRWWHVLSEGTRR